MLYVDTSALIPLFVKEVHSPTVRSWFGRQDAQDLRLSVWTVTEFVSALGAKVRSLDLTTAEARQALAGFADLARATLPPLVPTAADFELATRFVEDFRIGVRGPDALHLAVASNNGALEFATLDKALARAAGQFGFAVVSPF